MASKNNKAAARRKPARPAGQPGSRGSVYSWSAPDRAGGGNPKQQVAPPPPPGGAAGATTSTPAGLGAVTPIAAPPVVTQPFLTLGDQATQALELSDVKKYLEDVDFQTTNQRIAATQKLGDIDTAEGRNLEATDWNTASRGLAQSSIRDTSKANLSADAQRSRTATQDTLKAQEDYGAAEHHRVDTEVRPALDTKWSEIAKGNAQAKTDAEGSDESGGQNPTVASVTAPVSNIYKPGTNEWAAYAVAHNESWKQSGGKWYRKTASGRWMPAGNAGE